MGIKLKINYEKLIGNHCSENINDNIFRSKETIILKNQIWLFVLNDLKN